MGMNVESSQQEHGQTVHVTPQALARSVAQTVADEPEQVGEATRQIGLDDNVTDFRFASNKRGYEGWEWSVTLYHDVELDEWTVNESSLVPTDAALVPPAWVPWKDRLLPTDLSVTDAIGTEPDDPRLEDGFRPTRPASDAQVEARQPESPAAQAANGQDDEPAGSGARVQDATGDGPQGDGEAIAAATTTQTQPEDTDEDGTARQDIEDSVEEFMLSRRHVLSPLGRDQTAKRWYEGPHGPKALSTKTAAGNVCSTCGFFVPLKGDFDRMFGVCANKWSPDDGRVVSLDHGCGEHSEIDPPEPSHLWVQSKPAYDDTHIDVIAQAPREERGQVELLEEASEDDIDNNTVEDDETDIEDTGETSQTPQVESVITMDDLEAAGFPDSDDDDTDGADESAEGGETVETAASTATVEHSASAEDAGAAGAAQSSDAAQPAAAVQADDTTDAGNDSADNPDATNVTDAAGAADAADAGSAEDNSQSAG
ncbi:DUF3027 domain-containing protein [Bifidobacterium thermophilum]|uniref:DUF3027 domain-containing protein n=1 Tax=Bifidobacterium thermophilum TaxID=33905 RepID=UPI0030DD6102